MKHYFSRVYLSPIIKFYHVRTYYQENEETLIVKQAFPLSSKIAICMKVTLYKLYSSSFRILDCKSK